MREVQNKKVVNRIADRSRKAARGRNLIIVFAIVLTTVLFTSVFTVGGSIIIKLQEETMRQVGGSAHAGYKYLTQEEYDVVKKDPWLKEISYRVCVGTAVNDLLSGMHTEINFSDDLDAKLCFSYPEIGEMPREEKEIVTSDLVLKELGVPCELGAEVPLVMDIGGRIIEDEFILSGYYTGDNVSMAQNVLVSKAYQEKVAPIKTIPMRQSDQTEDQYTGRIMADFNFYFGFALEEQAQSLNKRCGFPENMSMGVNWAYMGNELDATAIIVVMVLLFVIMLSGYLIIYNVFYINVYADIRHYGLLKTIGMTGAQLKILVKRQADILSLVGIPFGLLGGYGVGKILLPFIMKQFVFYKTTNTETEINAWIFLGAAMFAYLTVSISCKKPCKMASKVSPIEALRMTEATVDEGRKKCKEKKIVRVNPYELAKQNIKRNRKRMVIVVTSLSLALVLLNSTVVLLKSFDMDKYASNMAVSDFAVSHASLDDLSVSIGSRIIDGVTEPFLYELAQQEGIVKKSNVYISERFDSQYFREEDWKKVKKRILEHPVVKEKAYQEAVEILHNLETEPERKEVEDVLQNIMKAYDKHKTLDGSTYGVGELVLEKLKNVEGTLDWELFKTGKYVITTRYDEEETAIDYFYPGEKIMLYNMEGEGREYEVMAVADIPYSCRFQVFGSYNCNYILPQEEFLDFYGHTQPMRTLIDVEEEYQAQMEQWMSYYCKQVNPQLKYVSKVMIKEEFQSLKLVVVLVGGVLVVILAIIGILNFVNTMVTSIISRKQELAMLEAVGMTGKQQKLMLIGEGAGYGVRTILVALGVATLLNVTVLRALCESLFFTTWHITITPILIGIPVTFIMVLVVPFICYEYMGRKTVVERLREFD